MRQIPRQSDILNDLFNEGQIGIAGGIYNVETGLVNFIQFADKYRTITKK